MASLIQANQALWNGPARRMLLLKWALCAAILTAVIFSPKLWMTDRAFPTLPLLNWLPDLPQAASLALAGLIVLSTLTVALLPRPNTAIFATIALTALSVAFDINRLQPCVYQYTLILAGLALMQWDAPSSARSKAAWAVCAVPIVAVYFWSGLQKANMTFGSDIFPWLLKPVFGETIVGYLRPYWFLAPAAECSLGILLLVPRTRVLGLAGATFMHGLLLLALGPFGLNYNSIVWPWNFWILTMAYILFLRNPDPVLKAAWTTALGKVVVLLIGIMPAFNFLDRWDGFLSASYYSGRLRDGWLYLSPKGVLHLPIRYSAGNKALVQESPKLYRLDITQWAIGEMNVPPYAEPRIYEEIVRKLRADGVPKEDMLLYVRDRLSPTESKPTYSPVDVR